MAGDDQLDPGPSEGGPRDEEDLDQVQRDFLDDPRRRGIVDLLDERPGSNKTQIAEALGLALNTVRHHLGRLKAVDLVETEESPRQGEMICFLVSDVGLWEEHATRILFGGSRVREAAILILEEPGSTAGEIGDAMQLSPGGVHHHLTTLLDHELVERFRIGQGYRYYPRAVLEAWHEDVQW